MDLVEFLTARLDEDEQIALAAKGEWVDAESTQAGLTHLQRWGPARVLADVAAKRSLIEQYQDAEKDAFDHRNDLDRGEWRAFWYSLRLFALPYADHPDYREEWRP